MKKVKARKPFYKKAWFWIIAIIIVIGATGGNDDSDSSTTNSNTETKVSQTQTIENKDDAPKDDVPAEYLNALKKAKSYSDMMHMSKAGIYDQLTSEYGEGFEADAAQYAIDNLDADWNENALKKAKSYSETMYMSKAGIYDQLTSEYGEQFTAEEAQYAIDNLD